MLPWKEKVSEKISHLFADSSDPHSPAALRSSQVRSYSQGKSFSSMFSYILPSSSFARSRSDKDRDDDMLIQSPSVKWNSPSTYQPLDRDCKEFDHACENRETPISHREDRERGSGRSIECENKGPLRSIKCENKGIHHEVEDPGSWRSTSSSDMFEDAMEDAMDQHDGERAMPYLTEESSFISANLYEFLLSALPNIVKGCQWVLLYSTVKHGISLRTLIRRSADLPGPCLLIVGDKHGAVFGGLLDCPLKPTPKRKYQGTNQTFVFTTIYGAPRLFRPTGANRYFYLCLNDLLALGGGGNFALCLDGDLMNGTSGPCETFGNVCLAHSQEFELKNVELWGFAHSSRYLS